MNSFFTNKVLMAVAAVLFVVMGVVAAYWFQQQTVVAGSYTVVYYKNRCNIDSQALPADLESLKALPCLIRINWAERIDASLEQEYCYRPDRGVEKTRMIQKTR